MSSLLWGTIVKDHALGVALSVVGFSHQDTAYDIRSSWSLNTEQLPQTYTHLQTELPNDEHLILATCNRLEIYSTHVNTASLKQLIIQHLEHLNGSPQLQPNFYSASDCEALNHMMCVAAGLKSLIIFSISFIISSLLIVSN